MSALGFSPNSISHLAPPAVGAKTWRAGPEHSLVLFPSKRKLVSSTVLACKASSPPSSSSLVTDYDLYDLLGVEGSSDLSQIKNAYRTLQKHCHPDIAGPCGHDMAVILNEAYAVLSDPNSRTAYDTQRAKKAEFRDYTGNPLYSAWFGPESEQRAVFVDEVRCVGCLKCALFASRTFAIESAYGRARVVGQWADPEHKILHAIDTCPVDCISVVARSDLAALEYLMSKQPRGPVRMTGGAGGAGDIFADVNKFQRRYNEMKDKASTKDFQWSRSRREAIASAMQGIRSISHWWCGQTHAAAGSTFRIHRNQLARFTGKPTETPGTWRLQEAAAKRRAGVTGQPAGRKLLESRQGDEYWTPALLLPSPLETSVPRASTSRPAISEVMAPARETPSAVPPGMIELPKNHLMMRIPEVVAAVAAAVVGFDGGEAARSGLGEHVGGTVALEIVNSFWLQILLAGVTWYVISAAVVGLVAVLGSTRLRW